MHISSYLSELTDRGDLPERLDVIRTVGPHKPGDTITWDSSLRGYKGRNGYMMLAGVARDPLPLGIRCADRGL